MLDLTAATVPAQTFKTVDILTLIALITGPAIAVGIQLWIEKRRYKYRARFQILQTLMAYRGRLHHPDSVVALNSVELIFNDKKQVILKLKEYLDYMETERSLPENERPGAFQRREDLMVELISTMSESLGYKFGHTAIKRRAYLPQGWVNEETYQLEMRNRILALTQNGALPVSLINPE